MTENKVSPIPISVLIAWILITLLVPVSIYFYIIAGNMAVMGYGIPYALIWTYIPYGANLDLVGTSILGIYLSIDPNSIFSGLHILHPLVMMWVPVYGGFNILFAVQVVRYSKGKTSLRNTIIAGLLTLAIPLYEVAIFLPYMLSDGYLRIIGPIPIQLIVGLILIKKYGPKPLATPWE
ncbi:MAG: hypothetical protein ACFFFO_08085 [Candidatus Thorarchaeota archaeon]